MGWNCTSQKAQKDSSKAQMSRCSPIEIFLLGFFSPPDFWLLHFSFGPVPPWKRWDRCCKMGPACHPLCTIKFLFLDYFWLLIFDHFLFLSIPGSLSNGDTAAAKWDPHVILYVQSSFFSWIIFGSWYLVTCLFLSISCHVWNVEEPAGSWDPHVILYVL